MRREIDNPIFNDKCTFLRTSDETKGVFSDMIVELGAQGKNPMHKHTQFEETFIALEGNLGLNLDGRRIILSPGEKITVRKKEPHCFFNPSNETIKFHLQFTPGHRGAENMLRILYGLAEDGLANNIGVPKSLKTIALLGRWAIHPSQVCIHYSRHFLNTWLCAHAKPTWKKCCFVNIVLEVILTFYEKTHSFTLRCYSINSCNFIYKHF